MIEQLAQNPELWGLVMTVIGLMLGLAKKMLNERKTRSQLEHTAIATGHLLEDLLDPKVDEETFNRRFRIFTANIEKVTKRKIINDTQKS